MSKIHSTKESFSYAISGIKIALKNEPNFRVHSVIAVLTIIVSILLKISPSEFAVIVLTIGFVIILELINTMLEALVDLVSPQIQDKAKIAKDVSAASVLVSTMLALIVGFFIFYPKIINLLLN